MRAAILGDSHYKETSRFEECQRIHDWIANDAQEREVDVMCHTGDVYNGRSTEDERLAVARWVKAVTDHCPLIIVRGNHDRLRELRLLQKLETKYPVVVEEAVGIHTVAGISIACMAWPRRAELFAALDQTAAEQANANAAEFLRTILRNFRNACNGEGPHILLAHAMVRGSKVSTGQEMVGCDFELGLEDLALAGAPLVALGHIHKAQEWRHGNTDIIYTGSPRRTNFGETEEKSYTIVEMDRTALLKHIERIPTPATQLLTIETQWVNEHYGISGECEAGFLNYSIEEYKGAEVRFRYTVDSEYREIAKQKAEEIKLKFLEQGAISCNIEDEVTPSTRAKLPEITTVSSIEDKLKMFWESRGDMPDPSRIDELFRKARELEAA